MAQKQLMLPGETVKKSNALARAGWPVQSVLEPRLIALVASRVKEDDKDFFLYEIPTTELLGPQGNKDEYKQLREACTRLVGTVIDLPTEDGGWTVVSIFSSCRHDPRRKKIIARFDPALKSHYLILGKKFYTKYNLLEFLQLPTTYSQRLFEVLKSWDDQVETTINLHDLFQQLGVPLGLQRYQDFRRKVLVPAHAYITERTSLTYQWQPIKHGRAYVAIKFVFSAGRQAAVVKQAKAKDAQDLSTKRNQALIAATKCYAECKGRCQPADRLQCQLCNQLVQIGKRA